MKNFIITLFICFAAMGLNAQETQNQPAVEQPASTDSIIFEKLVHDYGTIEQGGNGVCEFKYTNKGEKPLVLSNVKASCGCTVPKWPREPLEAGQSNVISVKYNTNNVGSFSKSITVTSNASNTPVVLRIKGTVVKKPVETPAAPAETK